MGDLRRRLDDAAYKTLPVYQGCARGLAGSLVVGSGPTVVRFLKITCHFCQFPLLAAPADDVPRWQNAPLGPCMSCCPRSLRLDVLHGPKEDLSMLLRACMRFPPLSRPFEWTPDFAPR